MKRNIPRIAVLLGLATLCCYAGCTAWQPGRLTQRNGIATKRESRKADAIRKFDQQRDEAQFQAALARWKQGDPDAARGQLEELLGRSPSHAGARLLLAECQVWNGSFAAALDNAQRVLGETPDEAAPHFTLALAADALGQNDLAAEHYRRAVALEPNNEIFRVALAAWDNPAAPPTDGAARATAAVGKAPSAESAAPAVRVAFRTPDASVNGDAQRVATTDRAAEQEAPDRSQR